MRVKEVLTKLKPKFKYKVRKVEARFIVRLFLLTFLTALLIIAYWQPLLMWDFIRFMATTVGPVVDSFIKAFKQGFEAFKENLRSFISYISLSIMAIVKGVLEVLGAYGLGFVDLFYLALMIFLASIPASYVSYNALKRLLRGAPYKGRQQAKKARKPKRGGL